MWCGRDITAPPAACGMKHLDREVRDSGRAIARSVSKEIPDCDRSTSYKGVRIRDAALEMVQSWSGGEDVSIAVAPLLDAVKRMYPSEYREAFRNGWGTNSGDT